MMKQKNLLESRLSQLKSEFESGQTMLNETNKKRSDLEATLLRISGAIQVLEELLEPEDTTVEEGQP